MKKFHLDNADAARGIAILLVFSFHCWLLIIPGYGLNEYRNGVLQISSIKSFLFNFNPVGQGWAGVQLFLIISGFLLHFIHLRSKENLNLRVFFSKRFWRVYPPYIIVLLFFFFYNEAIYGNSTQDLLSHIFLVHNLDDKTIFTINPSFWSIALECQLYLLYPLYLYIIKRIGANKAFGLVLLLSFILSAISLLFNIRSQSYNASPLQLWFVWCSGAWLADKFYHGKRIFQKPWWWLLLFCTLFIACKLFYYSKFFMVIPVAFACIVLLEMLLHCHKSTNTWMSRISFKSLSFIGVISYSFYLIHQPLLRELLAVYNPGLKQFYLNSIISALLAGITIMIISYALYKLVETQSIRLGQMLRERKKR